MFTSFHIPLSNVDLGPHLPPYLFTSVGCDLYIDLVMTLMFHCACLFIPIQHEDPQQLGYKSILRGRQLVISQVPVLGCASKIVQVAIPRLLGHMNLEVQFQ